MFNTIRNRLGRCNSTTLVFLTILLLIIIYIGNNSVSVTNLYQRYLPVYSIKPSRYLNIVKTEFKNKLFRRSVLRGGNKTFEIYLHDADGISNEIANTGSWEKDEVARFKEYIKNNPGMQVMDAGCNVGVYTLTAASLGRRVVAIDADVRNTDRVAQSAFVNGFKNYVIVCSNALSNERKIYNLVGNDIGTQKIGDSTNINKEIQGIIMEDLIELFDKDKPILIKIDIEGNEINFFQKASKFFDERNVRLIMIEWFWIKDKPQIDGLITFLVERNFKPFKDFIQKDELDISKHKYWPINVIWIKA